MPCRSRPLRNLVGGAGVVLKQSQLPDNALSDPALAARMARDPRILDVVEDLIGPDILIWTSSRRCARRKWSSAQTRWPYMSRR